MMGDAAMPARTTTGEGDRGRGPMMPARIAAVESDRERGARGRLAEVVSTRSRGKRGKLRGAGVAVLLVCAAGCSQTHREQQAAFAASDRGEYVDRAIARAESAPPAAEGTAQKGWEATAADLHARAEAWKARDAADEVYAGFRALESEEAHRRRAELAAEEAQQAALGEQFALPDLWAIAALRNPAIRAAHDRWRAGLEQYEQAGFLENLALQYRAFTKTLDTGIGMELQKGEVQEVFPFPATVTLKGEIVDRDAAMAWQEWRQAIREVLVAVGEVHHELEYLDKALAVTRENRDLLARMEQVARTRYEAGASAQVDVLRIQSELSRSDYDLSVFEQERSTARARLNALLSRGADAPLGAVLPFEPADAKPEFELMRKTGLECRQEVAIQRLKIEQAELTVRLAETVVLPRASQGASLAQTGMGLEAGPDRSEEVFPRQPEAEPRFSFGTDEGYLRQIRREVEAERAELLSLEDHVRFEAKDLHFALDVARKQVALFEGSLLPQAEQALGATRSGYETGKLGFLDFIEAQRSYLDARLGLERSRRDLKKAINRLLQVLGCNAAG